MIRGWSALFDPHHSPAAKRVPFRIVRRRGEPLLLLPHERRCAAHACELYAAQTAAARLARAALRRMAGWGLPGLAIAQLSIDADAAFVRWLCELHGGAWPVFAVLPGNARTPGRRLLVLTFDTDANPCIAVKAGADEAARRLIEAEGDFLAGPGANRPAVPHLIGRFAQGDVAAIACAFVPGRTPRPADDAALGEMLGGWLDLERSVPLGELPAWQRLASPPPLGQLAVHPALFHGDFAPWNVKIHANRWTVLDWERGEPAGPPGWDWLHYVVQRAVLVQRRSTSELVADLETLFADQSFRQYLATAGLLAQGRLLTLSYLDYATEVLQPTEGLDALRALRTAWSRRLSGKHSGDLAGS